MVACPCRFPDASVSSLSRLHSFIPIMRSAGSGIVVIIRFFIPSLFFSFHFFLFAGRTFFCCMGGGSIIIAAGGFLRALVYLHSLFFLSSVTNLR
jgi:hypothetical protein